MENHIESNKLDSLMEQFMHENPYGDSRELAAEQASTSCIITATRPVCPPPAT